MSKKISVGAAQPASEDKGAPRANRPVFMAAEGFSDDFSDIQAKAQEQTAEPALGLDELLGVRWIRPRGKLIGLRFGTLRQRRLMEKQQEHLREEGLSEEEQYRAGLAVYESLLVLPDVTAPGGLRPMTVEEIEERIDYPDFPYLSAMAFPPISPLKALVEAGADPN